MMQKIFKKDSQSSDKLGATTKKFSESNGPAVEDSYISREDMKSMLRDEYSP